MEHKQLRKELVSLIKQVPSVANSQRFDAPLRSLQSHTESTEDLSLEYENTKTYRDLVDVIDALMSVENAHVDDQYEKKLEGLKLMHDYTGDGDIDGDENKLRYLKEMQEIRKLVIESGISTLPLLRSVHQVGGLSSKERSLAKKVYERDEISLEIMGLQKKVIESSDELSGVSDEVQSLLKEAKSLTHTVIQQNQAEELTPSEQSHMDELKQKYEKYHGRSEIYASELESIVVEFGLNWSKDEKLLEIIELCGTVYTSG